MAEMTDDIDPASVEFLAEAVNEAKLQAHPAQQQAFLDIARLTNDTRLARTLGDFRDLQQRLGQHIARVEAKVGHANERRSHLDRTLRRIHRRVKPASPTEIAAIEGQLAQALLDRELHLRLALQYRVVGDAMAWRLHNYQTRVIAAFGMNQGPGIIGIKAGAAAEAEQVETYWREQGAFALRHDFTNCLRVWDLTVCYPDPTRGVDIVEVKSSPGRVRSRQRNQIRRLMEFVDHRVATSLEGVLLIHRHQAPKLPDGPEQTNFPLIVQSVMDAGENGYSTFANSYFAVNALNLLHPAVQHPDAAMRKRVDTFRDTPREIMAHPCQDYLVADSFQRVLTPTFGAPYTIYPLWPNAISALVTGYLRLLFHLNTCAVVEAFQKVGFEAQYIPPRSSPIQVGALASPGNEFILQRGGYTLRLGNEAVAQMLFEGLPLEDLVESVHVEQGARERGIGVVVPDIIGPYSRKIQVLNTFLGLENLWRASQTLTIPEESLPTLADIGRTETPTP